MIIDEWKLDKAEEKHFKDIFLPQVLADRPLYSSGYKLYHKFTIKRYYFTNYPNKGSHKA